jgi:hypothetical protein
MPAISDISEIKVERLRFEPLQKHETLSDK